MLVLHGFTGSPVSVRPWAQALADDGLTVRLPLLPGHGTRWQDLNDTRWTDWFATAEASYEDLAVMLSINPASIGTLLARAKQTFREEYVRRYGQ